MKYLTALFVFLALLLFDVVMIAGSWERPN